MLLHPWQIVTIDIQSDTWFGVTQPARNNNESNTIYSIKFGCVSSWVIVNSPWVQFELLVFFKILRVDSPFTIVIGVTNSSDLHT